jgi:hypothetical protein
MMVNSVWSRGICVECDVCEPDLKSGLSQSDASNCGTGTTMQARRKPYRVETMDRVIGRANGPAHIHLQSSHNSSHHDEIMSELRSLRALVKPSEQVTQSMIDAY